MKKQKRAVQPMAFYTWWTLISATTPRVDTVVALLVQSPEGIGAAEWTRRQGGGRKKNSRYHRFLEPPPRGGTAREKISHPYV